MTQTATTTSEPQRLRALERANEIRLARAGLKRRIAIGEVSAAEVIIDLPRRGQQLASRRAADEPASVGQHAGAASSYPGTRSSRPSRSGADGTSAAGSGHGTR